MKVLPLLLLLLLSSVLFNKDNTGIEIHFKHESLYIKAGWGNSLQTDNAFRSIKEERLKPPAANQEVNTSQLLFIEDPAVILSDQPEKQQADHESTENAPGKKVNVDQHVSLTMSSSMASVLSKAAKESFNRLCRS